jgi:hypothetical protein
MTILEAIKKNLVIHCETMAESDRILGLLHGIGVKYRGGKSLIQENYYHEHGDQTCYNLEKIPLNIDVVIDNDWGYYGLTFQEKYFFTTAFEHNRTVTSSLLIDFTENENLDMCVTVLVNHTIYTDNTPLGDYIVSKLNDNGIHHIQISGDYNDKDKIIRGSYFVNSRELDGWYYTMFLISNSQIAKAISLFNRYGCVVDINKIGK